MTTLSSFRINQPPGTPYANYDRARRDLDLGSVECEAYEKSESSYKWEFVSLPYGVSVTINNGTTHTCNFTIDTIGGYLIRLTVNEGDPDESMTTLYFGSPLEGSGKSLPALSETNQDNSQSPYDGARGSEQKTNEFRRSVDQAVWSPVREISSNTTLDSSDVGKTIRSTTTGVTVTLPETPAKGVLYRFHAEGGDVLVKSNAAGDGEIKGPFLGKYSTTGWGTLKLHRDGQLFIQALSDGAGSFEWYASDGNGRIEDNDNAGNTWDYGFAHIDDLLTDASTVEGAIPVADGSGGISMRNLTQFSKIIDPAASTLSLTSDDSGALVMTNNSTATDVDPHDIHLPTPAAGLTYTIQFSHDDSDVRITIDVDDSGTETISVPGDRGGAYSDDEWTGTQVELTDHGLVTFIGMSSTQWQAIINAGSLILDPGIGAEQEYAQGPFTITNGLDNVSQSSIMVRGRNNTVGSNGRQSVLLGYYGQTDGERDLIWGTGGKSRLRWNCASVQGAVLPFTSGTTPGRAQSVTIPLVATTTDDSWTTMVSDAETEAPLLESNSIINGTGRIVAKVDDHVRASKTWSFEFMIRVDNFSSATIQSKTITVTGETSYLNESTWDIDIDKEYYSMRYNLAVKVKGEASKTIYWVCTLDATEVMAYNL